MTVFPLHRLLRVLRMLARGTTGAELQAALGLKSAAVSRLVAQIEAAGLQVERHHENRRQPGRPAIWYTVTRREVDDWLWRRPIPDDERVACPPGRVSHRGQRPFGKTEAAERETLAIMRALRAKGCGVTDIARQLNAQRRPTRRGGKWFPAVVFNILRRRCTGEDESTDD